MQNGTVLVAEDEGITRTLMMELLRSAGYEVLEATSAEECFELLANMPDAILLDVQLGGDIDGVELLRRLRGSPRTKGIPVVFVTAYSTLSLIDSVREVEEEAAGRRHPVVHVIAKPFLPTTFMARFQAALKAHAIAA